MRLTLNVLIIAVGATLLLEQAWRLATPAIGCDFVPLRHAAQAVLDGASVYRDPFFVYPPTAALVLVPTAAFGESTAFACWLLLIAFALTLTAAMIARQMSRPWRLTTFALTLTALLGGAIAQDSLYAGNLSPLLTPVAVGVLLAFGRGRWAVGCALLAASLLVKPLLVPLILIPLVSRRWRPLLGSMIPAAAALLISMITLPGGMEFPEILWRCLTGSNLHGTEAVNNLSLRGWTEAHHLPPAMGVMAAALVAAAVIGRVSIVGIRAMQPVQLGTIALLATFLTGAISEVSYLFIALAAAMLLGALDAKTSDSRWWALLPGAAPLCSPFLPHRPADQTWFVAGQLLLLAGALAITPRTDQKVRSSSPFERTPSVRRREQSWPA